MISLFYVFFFGDFFRGVYWEFFDLLFLDCLLVVGCRSFNENIVCLILGILGCFLETFYREFRFYFVIFFGSRLCRLWFRVMGVGFFFFGLVV